MASQVGYLPAAAPDFLGSRLSFRTPFTPDPTHPSVGTASQEGSWFLSPLLDIDPRNHTCRYHWISGGCVQAFIHSIS